jgi:hypothetical protein
MGGENNPLPLIQTHMKNIVDQIAAIAQSVDEGNSDALSAYVEFKRIEKVLEASMKQVFEEAITEANRYTEKTFSCNGAEVTKKSNPGRWDFKSCPRVESIASKLKEAQEQAKAAYNQSQKGAVLLDEDQCLIEPASYAHGADGLAIKILAL